VGEQVDSTDRGLLHVGDRGACGAGASVASHSNCHCQLSECDTESPPARLFGDDLVVSAAQVLDEGGARGEHPELEDFLGGNHALLRGDRCGDAVQQGQLSA
jgi:hypothetical protein